MSTPNRGYFQVPTTSPDYNTSNPGVLHDANWTKLDATHGIEVESASGAIGIKEGVAIITKGSIAALTLVAPTAGLPAAGGDDGKVLRIVSTTAFAHTVTTPAGKINGNKLTATYAAVGDNITLVAYNGVWYTSGNTTTLS